ncbi:uncharacterized protein BO96DRAFT_436966 [Aspergillus niger CBS 101883]|uniref:Contig An12c0060, genomic contig n=2 Tax=Aspergillus niger TaxID=5061 RepID=A2QYL7_ASPNC|nr:uncharacterized protein BO96DRAFT_436966 [Aspergillus niger CBS 101883]XP_059605521.1 uncharacterized protein An12g01690 [Aspergillus niger]PYH53675.1 hypothetical protein BO96DRAFT_436966 [Aspergillus niger CBS 101883]CAK48452.1 unnamed protein product [Aspergillus niger]
MLMLTRRCVGGLPPYSAFLQGSRSSPFKIILLLKYNYILRCGRYGRKRFLILYIAAVSSSDI